MDIRDSIPFVITHPGRDRRAVHDQRRAGLTLPGNCVVHRRGHWRILVDQALLRPSGTRAVADDCPPQPGTPPNICVSPMSGCARRWTCSPSGRPRFAAAGWSISAAVLATSPRSSPRRFPQAEVTGIDASAPMLPKARAAAPSRAFRGGRHRRLDARHAARSDLLERGAALGRWARNLCSPA